MQKSQELQAYLLQKRITREGVRLITRMQLRLKVIHMDPAQTVLFYFIDFFFLLLHILLKLVLTFSLDSSITHDPIKDKTFNEAELRRRRQRTEKHVALIAKENPELLDQQTKEIISRINPKNLKRK